MPTLTPLLDRLAADDPQLTALIEQRASVLRSEFDRFCFDVETLAELAPVRSTLRRHWQDHLQALRNTAEPPTLPPGLPEALREQLYTDLCRRAGVPPEPATTQYTRRSEPAPLLSTTTRDILLIAAGISIFVGLLFTTVTRIGCTVRNESGRPLRSIVAEFHDEEISLPDLSPGKSRSVTSNTSFQFREGQPPAQLTSIRYTDVFGNEHSVDIHDLYSRADRDWLVTIDAQNQGHATLQGTPRVSVRSNLPLCEGGLIAALAFFLGYTDRS